MTNIPGKVVGAHELMLGAFGADSGKDLARAARLVTEAGGSVIELTCVNPMGATELADALQEGGITNTPFCCFWPGGDDAIDPIEHRGRNSEALKVVEAYLDKVEALQRAGLQVDFFTGPSCFKIGHDYKGMPENVFIEAAISFYDHFKDRFKELGLTIAIEYLRPSEDVGALRGFDRIRQICEALGENFGWHADIFHMWNRGYIPEDELLAGRTLLKYIHAHGNKRNQPGSDLDSTNWHAIANVLSQWSGPLVFEDFCQDIRDNFPELGEGLPPVVAPASFITGGIQHFKKVGLLAS